MVSISIVTRHIIQRNYTVLLRSREQRFFLSQALLIQSTDNHSTLRVKAGIPQHQPKLSENLHRPGRSLFVALDPFHSTIIDQRSKSADQTDPGFSVASHPHLFSIRCLIFYGIFVRNQSLRKNGRWESRAREEFKSGASMMESSITKFGTKYLGSQGSQSMPAQHEVRRAVRDDVAVFNSQKTPPAPLPPWNHCTSESRAC